MDAEHRETSRKFNKSVRDIELDVSSIPVVPDPRRVIQANDFLISIDLAKPHDDGCTARAYDDTPTKSPESRTPAAQAAGRLRQTAGELNVLVGLYYDEIGF